MRPAVICPQEGGGGGAHALLQPAEGLSEGQRSEPKPVVADSASVSSRGMDAGAQPDVSLRVGTRKSLSVIVPHRVATVVRSRRDLTS